jgi:hypothetical protein
MLEVIEWANGQGFTLKVSEHDAESIYLKLEQSRHAGDVVQGSNYDIEIERQDD